MLVWEFVADWQSSLFWVDSCKLRYQSPAVTMQIATYDTELQSQAVPTMPSVLVCGCMFCSPVCAWRTCLCLTFSVCPNHVYEHSPCHLYDTHVYITKIPGTGISWMHLSWSTHLLSQKYILLLVVWIQLKERGCIFTIV